MLVPLPIGLFVFSFVCDLIYQFGGQDAVWKTVAFYTMAGGVVGALLAAIPGLIDLLSLPRALRRTGLLHMTINLVVVALFAANFWMRLREGGMGAGSKITLWMSVAGIVLLAMSGWLGGKLVYEHGVAVDTDSAR
jgi:uncharacterized membrane protein